MTIIAEHSPGPWSYHYSPYTLQTDDAPERELPAFEVLDAEQNKIFDTNEDLPSEVQEANACLASAAPKLLAALEGALYALDPNRDGAGPSKQTAIADAIAAVAEAKATGITPTPAEPAARPDGGRP
jgi:hypothetical protein